MTPTPRARSRTAGEVLLTGGTLARAVAEGHRVVLVVATDGAAGLTSSALSAGSVADLRGRELASAAAALGIDDVRDLGYGDSGMDGRVRGRRTPFVSADLDEAAGRLADVLREVRADVLTSYDAAGGYGHPDHVRVHVFGREWFRESGRAPARPLLDDIFESVTRPRVVGPGTPRGW